MTAQIVPIEICPDTTVSLALFRDVENSKEIKQCIMQGTFEAALLKPSMVTYCLLDSVVYINVHELVWRSITF